MTSRWSAVSDGIHVPFSGVVKASPTTSVPFPRVVAKFVHVNRSRRTPSDAGAPVAFCVTVALYWTFRTVIWRPVAFSASAAAFRKTSTDGPEGAPPDA